MTVSAPMDFEVFQNSIHEWFSDASGLFVIWRDQGAPVPDYPYGTLKITSGPIPYAPQWQQETETNLSRPQGEEIKITVAVPCRIVVSVQAAVNIPDSRNPHYNAGSYIRKAQSALSLPSVLAVLRADGVAVERPGPILNIDEIVNGNHISRANMDVMFGAVLSLDDYTGYIKQVEGRSVSLGIDQTFGVDI